MTADDGLVEWAARPRTAYEQCPRHLPDGDADRPLDADLAAAERVITVLADGPLRVTGQIGSSGTGGAKERARSDNDRASGYWRSGKRCSAISPSWRRGSVDSSSKTMWVAPAAASAPMKAAHWWGCRSRRCRAGPRR